MPLRHAERAPPPSSPRGATVVHVITGLGMAGSELSLARLATAARRHRHVVVSLADEGAIGPQLASAGVRVHTLGMKGPLDVPRALYRLRRILRSERADIVQGWLAHGNFLATLAHGLPRSGAVLLWNIRQSLSDIALERRSTRALIRLNARLSRRPLHILYNSERSAAQHEAIGYAAEKRRLIPNGFDLARFAPSMERRRTTRSTLGIADDAPLVGLIGRFHPTKNHRAFLAAASEVLESHPEARFLLAGPGVTPDNPELRAMAGDARLRQRCLFLGARDDVHDLNNALDIACNVSVGESFSNTMGEAMASGIPCVVTDSGDSVAIVGDSGIVCADGGPEAIAAAIGTLIEAGVERRGALGEAARRRMEEMFSLETMVTRYEELYDDVLEKPHRREN